MTAAGVEPPMTARRWVATGFGGPEVLAQQDVAVPAPAKGEVIIDVRAAGVNPGDLWHIMPGQDPRVLPLWMGYEVSGVISALGPDTEIASGGGRVGDDVLAWQVQGGYATTITAAAADVFAKPAQLGFVEAANLLLVATAAAELLHASRVTAGETILLHGASGAVGASVLQQARRIGVRVVGTTGRHNASRVAQFGGVAVDYGPGLEDRVRHAAPDGVVAALDTAGTDEANAASLALVADRSRIVTIAADWHARPGGPVFIGASNPASMPFRNAARSVILDLVGSGELVVPISRRFRFDQAREALALLHGHHPGGKLALEVGGQA